MPSVLRTSAGFVLALACIIPAAEATTRLDDWAQYDVPMTERAVSLADLIVTDSLGTHARPGAQFKQYRINAMGFRGRDVAQDRIAGRAIIVSGASETFGLYEPVGKEWPSQLQDSLARLCGSSVVVLNAAFAGMSLPTVQQDVDLRLAALQPRMGIYYPTPMQYLEAELPRPAPRSITSRELPKWQLRFVPRFRDAVKRAVPAALLDLARRLDTRVARAGASVLPLDLPEPERIAAFEQDLRALVGTYRRHGITPVLALHQNRFRDTTSTTDRRMLVAWERFYPRYTGAAILRFDSAGAVSTRQVARDSSVALIDASAALRARSSDITFADFSHFTDAGAAILAGQAARTIAPVACGAERSVP